MTSNSDKMGLRRPPYAFTEQGVAMLSAVLKSNTAIQVSILIMNAFVAMRKYIAMNQELVQRIDRMEFRLVSHDEKMLKGYWKGFSLSVAVMEFLGHEIFFSEVQ